MEDLESIASPSATHGASAGLESIWLDLARGTRTSSEQSNAAGASSHDYQSELATPELVAQIRHLLAAERFAGRLVCRYLADLTDRIHGQQDRELLAYADEFQAAAHFFDLGAREVRERVRVGRALRQLPQIEAAFVAGELSYSRVREVTRVAQSDTESEWLARARHLDMRTLERKVAGKARQLAAAPNPIDAAPAKSRKGSEGSCECRDGRSCEACGGGWARAESLGSGATDEHASGGTPREPASVHPQWFDRDRRDDGSSEPCDSGWSAARTLGSGVPDERASRSAPRERGRVHTQWLDHDSLHLTFELSADEWSLVERALEGARRQAATPLADAEALAAVARDALASQNQGTDANDPRSAVVVYECERWGKSELDTGAGMLELDPPAAATLGCGAREVDLASEGRSIERGGPIPPAIRRAVPLRDRCRVPACNRRRYVDVHHLVAPSEGGEHSGANCITLCTTHPRRLHAGQLLITGDADAEPTFHDAANHELPSVDDDGPSPAPLQELPNADPIADTDTSATHLGILNEHAVLLLQIMGRRGNWTLDDLADGSALPIPELQHALLLLELEGRVRRRGCEVDPV